MIRKRRTPPQTLVNKDKPVALEEKQIVKEDNSIRINKYIADSGFCSRRKADELILEGVVKVNGNVVKELGTKIKPDALVTINGDPISYYTHKIYILLNKPKDCITTTEDEENRKTVMDIVKRKERIFPIGRLDRNTTGALLLTNDGELANKLIHPKYKIEKIYNVGLLTPISLAHASQISKGVDLEDGMTSPCHVFVNPDDKKKITVTLTEGRYREIRRMFEFFGYKVKTLDRKFFAGISTARMKRGEYRFLNFKEVSHLRKLVGLK